MVLLAALWVGSSQLHQQQRTMGQIRAHGRTEADSLNTRLRRIEAAGMRSGQ